MNEMLWNEYNLIYGVYEGYGQQILTLKGWSVSIGIAALIAAYTQPVSRSGRTGILIAAFSAVPFWLTETLWKAFQRTYLDRILEIEACFRNRNLTCDPVQIATSWRASFSELKWSHWFEGIYHWHVLLPHAALLVAGVGLAIWHPPVPKPPEE